MRAATSTSSRNHDVNLAELSVKDAAEYLACGSRVVGRLKEAGLYKAVELSPWEIAGLGATGAAVGGLGGYLLGDRRWKKDKTAPDPWTTALSGALAGGGLAAGVPLAVKGVQLLQTPTLETADLQRLSELHAKINPSSLLSQGVDAATSALGYAAKNPWVQLTTATVGGHSLFDWWRRRGALVRGADLDAIVAGLGADKKYDSIAPLFRDNNFARAVYDVAHNRTPTTLPPAGAGNRYLFDILQNDRRVGNNFNLNASDVFDSAMKGKRRLLQELFAAPEGKTFSELKSGVQTAIEKLIALPANRTPAPHGVGGLSAAANTELNSLLARINSWRATGGIAADPAELSKLMITGARNRANFAGALPAGADAAKYLTPTWFVPHPGGVVPNLRQFNWRGLLGNFVEQPYVKFKPPSSPLRRVGKWAIPVAVAAYVASKAPNVFSGSGVSAAELAEYARLRQARPDLAAALAR